MPTLLPDDEVIVVDDDEDKEDEEDEEEADDDDDDDGADSVPAVAVASVCPDDANGVLLLPPGGPGSRGASSSVNAIDVRTLFRTMPPSIDDNATNANAATVTNTPNPTHRVVVRGDCPCDSSMTAFL